MPVSRVTRDRRTIVVTGCDHGLGLEVARAAAAAGARVFALCLFPGAVKDLARVARAHPGRVTAVCADLSAERGMRKACAAIRRKTRRVDTLFNVAGAYWRDGLDRVTYADLGRMMAINAFAPLLLVRHLRPLLRAARGAAIVNVSSEAGSLAGVSSRRPIIAYAMSKAALNMVTRKLVWELAGDRVRVISVHPGWMKTPMGRTEGDPTQEPSATAANLLRLSHRITTRMNGGFVDHDGRPRAW